ncbi:PilN domain-containing protein [Patescibacteria group bacterium]
MPNVNLIPEDQAQKPTLAKYSNMGLILVIIIVAAVVGGMFIYQRILVVREESLQAEISKVQAEQEQYAEVAAEAGTLQKQLSGLKSLLDNHVYWSELFWQLEETSLQDTVITALQASSPGIVKMTGSSGSYGNLAKQIVAYMSTPFFSGYDLSSATLSATADGATAVDFNIILDVNESALHKTDSQLVEDSLRSIELPTEVVVEEEVIEEGAEGETTTEEIPITETSATTE